MMRGKLLTSCAFVLLLAGCLDVGAENLGAEKTTAARLAYTGAALKNFALQNASSLDQLETIKSGPDGLRGLTCAKYDGKGGGVFFAWLDNLHGLGGGQVAGAAARGVGPEHVAQWSGGALIQNGQAMTLPEGCKLPALDDGSPVVVLPVKIPLSHPPIIVQPPCPASPVLLPSLGSVAEYSAALAPIEEQIKTMDATCPRVVVTSVAHWPYFQTFNLNLATPLIRQYRVWFPMRWEASAGAAWTERHQTWWGTYTNYKALPPAFRSHPEAWFRADLNTDAQAVATYSMDGRTYAPFVGANTAATVGQCLLCFGRAPLIYPNPPPFAPWGNTAAQVAYYSGISWNGFGSPRYNYVAGGGY